MEGGDKMQQPVDISDYKDTIIELQKHRIEQLEQAIGLARDDYYDKTDDYGLHIGDGDLWNHPLMANLMAVLARDGYTPMGKDTQICLVKAALRSMPEQPTPPTTTLREDEYREALRKIANAAVSSSPDAHYLGNVARRALGMEPLPKKERMP